MKNTHQHAAVLAFSGIVTVAMGAVIIQNMSPTTLSGDLMGRMGASLSSSRMNLAVPMPTAASLSSSQANVAFPMPTDTSMSSSQMNAIVPEAVPVEADPSTPVVVVTDELGNEVITYTEAQLNAAVMELSTDSDIAVPDETVEPTDGTEEISTGKCSNQTVKIGKVFTAAAGPKGTKTYSYCTEKTLKDIFNEHMDKAIIAYCGNFNANKYTKECADGCQQVSGPDGATGSFYEKARKYNINQLDDKTCKTVTGNSIAYTGSAFAQGDCTFTRVCEPFKSKFNQY